MEFLLHHLPRIMAPEARSFAARVESSGSVAPRSAKLPPVLFIYNGKVKTKLDTQQSDG
jgi:hypothetical protein